MTEYWKNSPNYWCKHCAVFVRDTKLERQNHEATGRHQNAIKRSLRDLHRTHDREQREKERARREIDRLNGVVAGSLPVGGPGAPRSSSPSRGTKMSSAGESSLKEQREQLARMGVSVPSAFLPDMAMPGEWTVTSSRVVGGDADADADAAERLATGVRGKAGRGRRRGEDGEEEGEDAVRGLFKKPRRWGRDTKVLSSEGEDAELEALLCGGVRLKAEGQRGGEAIGESKGEGEGEDGAGAGDGQDAMRAAEKEQEVTGEMPHRDGGVFEGAQGPGVKVKDEKEEEEEEDGNGLGLKVEDEEQEQKGDVVNESRGVAPVVFKKRKPKGLRTR
ncbi:hypothetical protein E4U41_007554 [Claviceps citrina]|nr:hypothetical protein E4U41_007554 [Claviceps citrina]